MTKRQRRFAEEFVKDGNASQAAIRAGFSKKSAGRIGHRLSKDVQIQKLVSELRAPVVEEAQMTLAGHLAMLVADVGVAVPRLHAAVPGLHEAYASFDEPPRHEELPVLRPRAVHLEDVGRLLTDIEGIGRLELHPVGELEGTDPRLEGGLSGALVEMARVERAEEVELLLLPIGAQ